MSRRSERGIRLRTILGTASLLCAFCLGVSNLTLQPGQAIAPALERLNAAGGGLCLLEPGLYSIKETLLLGSGVRLAGRGPGVIIRADEGLEGALLAGQKGTCLRDVVISNLAFDGGIPTSQPILDSSYLTKTKPHPFKERFGILLEDLAVGGPLSNIALYGVTVHSSAMGVHIKGCDGLRIEACRFERNGLIAKYFHNLYLRRDCNVLVRGCDLSFSTSGNGLNVSYCSNIDLVDNSAFGNAFRGIRVADSFELQVLSNRCHSNANVGILLNYEKTPVIGFYVSDNQCTGNVGAGLQLQGSRQGKVIGNTLRENAGGNLVKKDVSQVDLGETPE